MKKVLYLFLLLISNYCFSQENLSVTKKLQQTYQWVKYHDKSQSSINKNTGKSYYLVRDNTQDKTMGLCDEKGNLIVPTGKYEYLGWRYMVYTDNKESSVIYGIIKGRTAFLNKYGKEIFEAGKYRHVEDGDIYYLVFNGKKQGVANKNGEEIIRPQYDHIKNCGIGFIVKKGNKYNIINYQGKPYFSDFNPPVVGYNNDKGVFYASKINSSRTYISERFGKRYLSSFFIPAAKEYIRAYPFSSFANEYVSFEIKEWQRKKEHETISQWKERLEHDRDQAIQSLLNDAMQKYITPRQSMFPNIMSLGEYDPDNQTYIISSLSYDDILIKIPREDAEFFKSNFSHFDKTFEYSIENDQIEIKTINFHLENKQYLAERDSNINYNTLANIDYNFEPINISSQTESKKPNIASVDVIIGKSDVDINIPSTNTQNVNTFAVIIANESYRRESRVEFAANDGEIFKRYCIKTLGLPEKNIHHVTNATLNDIRAEINWITKVAENYKGEATIIFYYAGHGVPDESSRSAYLLPVDGYGSDVTTGFSLKDLYTKLSPCPSKAIVILLDACFSGAQRNGGMLASARGIKLEPKTEIPTGNMIVFSASQGDETAYPYREKEHGMFTYFLLKKLQASNGNVTLGELSDYLIDEVSKLSIVENMKSQTPAIVPAKDLLSRWRQLTLN